MSQIKVSKTITVNPKHVVCVLLNEQDLKTVVVMIGGIKVPSEHSFDETIKLLNGTKSDG